MDRLDATGWIERGEEATPSNDLRQTNMPFRGKALRPQVLRLHHVPIDEDEVDSKQGEMLRNLTADVADTQDRGGRRLKPRETLLTDPWNAGDTAEFFLLSQHVLLFSGGSGTHDKPSVGAGHMAQ